MSFNIEVQGGKNYLLPTGGKYCPMDIEIAAIGGKEGRYCWLKRELSNGRLELTGVSVTLTPNGDGYLLASVGSGGAWGKYYGQTKIVDTALAPLTITFTVASTGVQKGLFLGFCETNGSAINNFVDSIYLDAGNTQVTRYVKGNSGYSFGPYRAGDVFTLTAYNGKATVYQNEIQRFDYSISGSTNLCAAFMAHNGNTTYGVIRVDGQDLVPLGYVVDDDAAAHPNNDYAADGYYYESVNEKIGDMTNALSILGVEVEEDG